MLVGEGERKTLDDRAAAVHCGRGLYRVRSGHKHQQHLRTFVRDTTTLFGHRLIDFAH